MMAARAAAADRTLGALVEGLCPVQADWDVPVIGLALDSRRLRPGEVFLACVGHNTHGLDYLEQALQAGASAVLWEPQIGASCATEWRTDSGGRLVPLIAVPELSRQVGVIADRFYGHPSVQLFTVGVTGTNGKTSCSQFLAQALNRTAPCGVIGTLGTGLVEAIAPAARTTPDPVSLHADLAQMLERGAASVVMEVSSHGLDQGRVNGVRFDCAVFTNLTRDHLDYHGDMAAYGAAKRRLFAAPGLRQAVINHDDAFGREILDGLSADIETLSYGLERHGHRPEVFGDDLQLDRDGLSLTLHTPWGEGVLRSSLLGRFNASNLLAVAAVLLLQGMPIDEVLARLSATRAIAGRMERFEARAARPVVVVDYAHTPDALTQALLALREHTPGRLWCVFGCGGERDQGKRPLMGAAAEQGADYVVLTDDNPRRENPVDIIEQITRGMGRPDAAYVVRDRRAAIEMALGQADPGDVVLVAGKGHEDYQEVGTERRPFSDRAVVAELLGAAR